MSKPGGLFCAAKSEDKVEETLKNGAAGSATLMIMSSLSVPSADCARRMVIGPRTFRRTSEIKKQTEARTVESSVDGKRGSSLRPLKWEVNFFLTTHTHTYTDVHTALCNEEKACVSVCNFELNDYNSDKSLMMFKSEAFKRMPRYPMFVEGVMIEFLANSGASRSYVRPCDLPCQPSLIDKTN